MMTQVGLISSEEHQSQVLEFYERDVKEPTHQDPQSRIVTHITKTTYLYTN